MSLVQELTDLVTIFYEKLTTTSAPALDRLSVGFGGDIPVFPPFFALGLIAIVLILQVFLGRWKFLPWPLNVFIFRLGIFGAALSYFMQIKTQCEAELVKHNTHLHFTPVNGLVTTGPYQLSRNPLYLAFTLLVPGVAVLADSLLLLLASPAVNYYLDKFVIPKEEQLLAKKFPKLFAQYSEKVPRWLKF